MKLERGDTFLFITIIFALFGIFFVSTIIHEMIHVYQGKGHIISVCITSNTKLYNDTLQDGYVIAYTEFDKDFSSLTTYSTWREEREKITGIMEYICIILLSFFFGLGLYHFLKPKTI